MPPFILLDDARPGGQATLFSNPVEIVRANEVAAIEPALQHLREWPGYAAGFLAYEAAVAFESRAAASPGTDAPYLWFGLFDRAEKVEADAWLPDPAGAWTGTPRPLLDRAAYLDAVGRTQQAIHAGDIYQANISFAASVALAGDPRALYAGLRRRARAGWGALLFTGEDWLLSLSPEQFFTSQAGVLTARPMKGTAPPDADPERLRADPKQRAENLMIVDLLRNDLARVSVPGSVTVPKLFTVERYPTVQQMVSVVTARLEPGRDAIDALRALFPCGSITGAPKIQAMRIIADIEQRPRGIYTGAIGRLDPDGDAAFNVAIRTLHLKQGAAAATLGLGSGIVADSMPEAEWRECLTKGEFVASETRFDLIETMAFDPVHGLERLDRHIARMKASAELFGFAFDRHAARNELQAGTFRLRARSRVRLLASRQGGLAIEVRPASPPPAEPVPVAITPRPVEPDDFRLRHKTTDRAFYEKARIRAGTFEVALIDAAGFVTEGSFTNIFVERGGTLLTPPIARGLLPGVLRAALIDEGAAIETELRPEDLAGGFLIGNSARGLLPARLVPL